MSWVRAGGRLLLFADRAPIAGAARDLGAVFGVMMVDAYTDAGPGPDVFRVEDGTLAPHPVQEGRGPAEAVDHVMTFTGQAFRITDGWEPLLVFGPDAVARINVTQAFQRTEIGAWPSFSVAVWTHGRPGSGTVAASSSWVRRPGARPARRTQRSPMGMNAPAADQNAPFCLNRVRWLTGVLEG